jgi:hypothetical protein
MRSERRVVSRFPFPTATSHSGQCRAPTGIICPCFRQVKRNLLRGPQGLAAHASGRFLSGCMPPSVVSLKYVYRRRPALQGGNVGPAGAGTAPRGRLGHHIKRRCPREADKKRMFSSASLLAVSRLSAKFGPASWPKKKRRQAAALQNNGQSLASSEIYGHRHPSRLLACEAFEITGLPRPGDPVGACYTRRSAGGPPGRKHTRQRTRHPLPV